MDDVGTRMKQLADLTKHRDTAQDNISDAQKKQKKRYDIKHRGSIFEIGDHVAIVNRRRDTRKGDKLAPRFKGPYTVTQTLGKGLYVLKKGDAVLKTKYNAVNLKRWNKPESATKSVRTEELPQRSSKWVPKFKLNESDRCDILNGAWLSDRVIDACHMLITESTGIQNQSTLLKQTAFKPMDTTVQILHDHDHWVTVSGSKDGIQFADSIPSHPITDNIKRQMKEIFKNRLNTDGNDCGVFAIANAFQLAQDMSPSVKYNIANIRNHILKCIEDRKMRASDYMSLRKKSMDKIVCI
ncbi:uncharacterized protein LOC121367189 [Gigantopelta aegis]|uniref:uncharacterized protein LOC121367189 n=1 Tax=Gigantopelta aegis TaxID=1735272 RepID=UPI001B887F67|nr:uncharacterized protein LOC121367189 [Gigantopelta aegis]